MKTSTPKFSNFLRIFEILSETRWTKAFEIAMELDVSERTIWRYIAQINDGFPDYPVIESSKEGYRLVKNDFLTFLRKREDDSFALEAVLSQSPLGTIISRKSGGQEVFLSKLAGRLELKTSIPADKLRPIFNALMKSRCLITQYHKNKEINSIEFVPLRLVMEHNIPYLNILDLDDVIIKLIAIDKMEEIRISEKIVDPKEIEKHRLFLQSAWGIMITENIHNVRFQVISDILPYFKNTSIHSSQKFITVDNPFSVISVDVHNLREFVRFTLRFGRAIKIIDPEEAIEEVHEFLEDMLNYYKK